MKIGENGNCKEFGGAGAVGPQAPIITSQNHPAATYRKASKPPIKQD